jgi:2-desacetyl-2-hydroxyethyl bacteriochlorophyllide A dehydrogenase
MPNSNAIVFPAENRVEIQSYVVRDPAAGELLVRTEYSGVSQGTEIWTLIGKRPELKYPTVPGYQSIGIIEAIGQGVQGYQVGQRVLFGTSLLPSQFPETWMGGHVSHAIVPVRADGHPVIVPDATDPIAAATAYLPAVSLRGIRMVDVEIGDLVVVTGQGLIGAASAQFAKLRGAIVVASDMNPSRLKLSKEHSADIVVNPKEQDLGGVVRSIKPRGADVVIETTGRSDQFAPCVDLLRWEGQILLQGYYPQPITFNFHDTHMKKPRVAVTCGCDAADAATCMTLMQYGKLHQRELITHVVPVTEAPGMYEKMKVNDPSVLGVVFDWRQ